MGGIVTKGNLKLGISTNGKSPTLAKRLRQLFEEIFPEEIDTLLNNLDDYRATLKQDFEEKVETLNQLTESLIQQNKPS
jgi:precorrin-2 dehydrogenase/sirohydrochlorin ferrochelatase